jgi:hypothetical protein
MPAVPNAIRRMLQGGFPLCLMPSRPLSPLHVAIFHFVDHCTVVRGQSLHPLRLKGLRSASCTLEQQESQTGSLIQALLFSTLLLPPEKLLKELLTRRIAILRRLGRFLHRGKLVRG